MNIIQTRKRLLVLENTLKNVNKSREISISLTKLQEARMFCSSLYGHLSNENFYKNDGKRESVKDIEPLFDAQNDVLFDVQETGHVKSIDLIRMEIKKELEDLYKLFDLITDFQFDSKSDSTNGFLDLIGYRNSLTSSRMWLGMELNRLYDGE